MSQAKKILLIMLHAGLILERKHLIVIVVGFTGHHLWRVEALWPNKDCSIGSLEDDVELKREAKTNTVQIVDVLANTERRVSIWAKLKLIVGYVLLYKKNCSNLVLRVIQHRKKSQIERFIATRTS